jgi:hypothetical protein
VTVLAVGRRGLLRRAPVMNDGSRSPSLTSIAAGCGGSG